MSLTAFMKIVFFFDTSSLKAIRLARLVKLVVVLTMAVSGLFLFDYRNSQVHLFRYFVSIFVLFFFFRALVLSLIDTHPAFSTSVICWIRPGMTYLFLFLFVILLCFGLILRNIELLATCFVCLVASTTAWSDSRYVRSLGYVDGVVLLVSAILWMTRPDVWMLAAAMLAALATAFLLSRKQNTIDCVHQRFSDG